VTTTENALVRAYLTRLDAALAELPAVERRQIVDGVEEHAATALAELGAPTEAEVRNVLSRLGEPEVIAADAAERLGKKRSPTEMLTTPLVVIGAVIGVFDLVAVSTSQVGPVEFAFLAIPVIALVIVARRLRRHPASSQDEWGR